MALLLRGSEEMVVELLAIAWMTSNQPRNGQCTVNDDELLSDRIKANC